MKSFLLKFLLFLLVQGAVFLAVLHRHRQIAGSDYLVALVDKLDRLERLPPPRLILAGGSGMAFGVDSEALEQALGLPAVNMGVHASLGLDFQLNTLKPRLREGDVVVLSFEYESLGGMVRAMEMLQIAMFRPGVLAHVAWPQGRKIADEMHLFVGGVVRKVVHADGGARKGSDRFYSRKEFDEYGDVRSRHRRISLWTDDPEKAASGKGILELTGAIPRVSKRELRRSVRSLRSFVAVASRKGAVVCYAYPPHPQPRMERSLATVEACERALADCEGLIMLNRPFDVAWPWGEFFDTPYHLTAQGMARRTEALIGTLRPVLEAQNVLPPTGGRTKGNRTDF